MQTAANVIPFPHGARPPRVLFIYPPVRLTAPPRIPPFGYLYMGAVLEEAGIEVEVLDLNAKRLPIGEVVSEIRRRRFDVVGIGGMTTVYYYIKLLSNLIKQDFPQTPIIGGGSACSASPEVVLKNTGVDVVCIGEGEPIVVELVKALVAKQPIDHLPGLAFRSSDGSTVRTADRGRFQGWPEGLFPAHHLVDMELYIRNNALKYLSVPGLADRIRELGLDPEKASRPVHIFSKRGCPFACTFCYRNFGRKVVYDSIGHVVDYMAMLADQYSTQHFVFGDELFNVSEGWVLEFCGELRRRGTRYLLSTSNGLRANCCTERSLRAMYEVGFYRVGIGIESFHDPSLKAMKKGQTAQQIKDAVKLISRVGLQLNEGGMLFGYPTDDWDAMRANIEGLTELGWFNTGFSIPCPYPGTSLYSEALEAGAIADEEEWLMELSDRDVSDRVINLSGRPIEELTAMIVWGNDQLAINQLARKYPRLSRVLNVIQPAGRRVLNLDLLGVLYRAKKGITRLLDGSLVRQRTMGRIRAKHREIALGMDGVNLVNNQGTNGIAALDFESGDRHLLAEALAMVKQVRPATRPLEFLVRRVEAPLQEGGSEGGQSRSAAD